MKFGVLSFGYANFQIFKKSIAEKGFISINLGDYMQTIAARRLLNEFGIPPEEIVSIDRDTIATYSGEPVVLLMNAVFSPWCFPIPETIIPVFVGFHTYEPVVRDHAEYFKRHEPIGCRDAETTERFRKYGIEAYTSGCVTLTLEPRANAPENGKPLIVFGAGSGALPADALRHMPEEIAQNAEFVFQRQIVHSHPLSKDEQARAERYTQNLLNDYRDRASLIVTPLHHVATPCIASGIPVVLCRQKMDPRFSFIRKFMPVHTENFAGIEWAPTLPDVSAIKSAYIAKAREGLDRAVEANKPRSRWSFLRAARG